MVIQWFSDPQTTKKEAQELHQPVILTYNPALVAETPNNTFVMGLLTRSEQWPPEWLGDFKFIINKEWGYTIVSLCDPLLGIWKDCQGD